MSFMNILGGLGAGVTQGLQNMQAIENQRTNTAMAKERQAMLKDEFDAKKAERQRAEDLSKLRSDLYQQHPDADRYQVESMFADQAMKAGKLRGQELDAAFNTVEKLKLQFGDKAYSAMKAGDIKPLQQVLGERGIAVDFTPDRKSLQLWRDGNPRDANGNLMAQTIPFDGLLQMDAFATTRQRMAEQAKLNQDSRKTESEIAKNVAQAGNYKAQAAGRTPYLEGPGGQLYPNPAFSGGKSGGSGRSGGTSGSGGAGSDDQAPPDMADFKDPVDRRKWLLGDDFPEGMDIPATDAQGQEIGIPRDQFSMDLETSYADLMNANRGLSRERARSMAVSMAKAKNGAAIDGGEYVPVPQLNVQTGQWETVVRSGDKVVARVPSAVVEPTPEERFRQESEYASRLSDQIGPQLTDIIKDPDGNRALSIALRDPSKMQVLERTLGIPNLARKLQVLYAYADSSGVLPDQSLNDARAQVARQRAEIMQRAQSQGNPSLLQQYQDNFKRLFD